MNYFIFETPEQVIVSLANTIKGLSDGDKPIHISLSGGSTPKLLFKALSEAPYQEAINWKNLHFWWGDERCVAPNDPESNFGEVNTLLFSHIDIPKDNIHRILGENEPKSEALRFAKEMIDVIPHKNGFPSFDWIILGMGSDGHTASLFPNKTDYSDQSLTLVAEHPESGQLRISKTAKLIENAARITYLVLGEGKAEILREIEEEAEESFHYPAANVKSTHGKTEWYLDEAAAKFIIKGE